MSDINTTASPRHSKQPLESCCFLFTPLAVLKHVCALSGALCGCIFTKLQSVSLLSICVQADGYMYFFYKGLNLNCLHCIALPLGLEVGKHILQGNHKHSKREQDEVMMVYGQTKQRHLCSSIISDYKFIVAKFPSIHPSIFHSTYSMMHEIRLLTSTDWNSSLSHKHIWAPYGRKDFVLKIVK